MQNFDALAKKLVAQMTIEEQASMLRYDAPAVPRLGVPAYNWWNEALHGVARAGTATVFPQAIGLAAAFDRDLISEVGGVIAEEGRAKYNAQVAHGDRDIYKGLTFWSPNVNIFRDPRWGRGHETYGEDPYLSGELGKSFVEALQQKDENGYMKAAACAKHLAAHSGPERLRHEFNAVVSEKDLHETYLPAFEALVTEAKVEGVMGAYNRTLGEPCCASPRLQKILREDWKFDGYFVSDCWAIADFHEHHKITDDALESAALAMKNGCDLNCGITYTHIMAAYERGMVSAEDITRSAERVMRTRLRLGLFDENCAYNSIGFDRVCCPEHIAVTRKAAEKSVVLLKNDGTLPLKNVRNIAVIGPNADSKVALLGNYHGTPDRAVTILNGLYAEADRAGFTVRYAEGCMLDAPAVEDLAVVNDRLSEAKTVAEMSDVAIVVLGLDETLEGEESPARPETKGDKVDLLLPECQRKLLEAVAETGTPTIVLLMAGSAIDLSYAQEHCAAVLDIWYPGARGGDAVADVLFGRVSPAGKLPLTFYKNEEKLPDFEDYSMKERTYRYYTGTPLYPFGYGLTYADMTLTCAALEDNAVRAAVHNASAFDAEEVVQVYAVLDDADAPVNPKLCGFARVRVPAGKTEEVTIPLSAQTYTVVNANGERVPCTKGAKLYVGFNQPDARSAELTGKTCLTL